MKGKDKDERIEEVRELLDSIAPIDECSTEEALDIMEEIQAMVEGHVDGLKSDLEAQGKAP